MEKEIINILENNSNYSRVYRCNLISITDFSNVAEEILALSPWKKFEGKVERFPSIVKYKNGVTRLYNTKVKFDLEKDSEYWDIYYYMPVPPLPEEK